MVSESKENQSAGGGRALIYIPIIHTQADMGTVADRIKSRATQQLGQQGWEKHRGQVNQLWSEIEKLIEGLPLNFSQVRLYQDGLPVCERESEIVRELAKAGSRNHGLLLRLMEEGATLMGAESPQLLVEEYQLLNHSLDSKATTSEEQRQETAALLLRKRDRYIAERINTTLGEGETGILFLGMLHSLEGLLSSDIQLIEPLAIKRGITKASATYRGKEHGAA